MGVKSKIAGHFVQIDSHINRCQSMTMTAMTVGGIYFCRVVAIYRANIIYITIYIILNLFFYIIPTSEKLVFQNK